MTVCPRAGTASAATEMNSMMPRIRILFVGSRRGG